MRALFLLLLAFTHLAQAENSRSKDQEKITASFKADNNVYTGLKVDTTIDFNTGMPGANFGVYSVARGNGDRGLRDGIYDVVGVHGTAVKNGRFWAAGMHCDVYDMVSGGTSICLNVEFPNTQAGTYTIGINMQPHTGAKNLVGMQIQNPESFKTAVDLPNMNWIFGDTDGATFGMRYDKNTQSLKFYRNIGQKYELLVHEIKMDFGQVK